MFSHDGSFSETANTYLRGSSLGTWDHANGNVFISTYWFFRYYPDGTLKSIAEALNKEELSGGGTHFTGTGHHHGLQCDRQRNFGWLRHPCRAPQRLG